MAFVEDNGVGVETGALHREPRVGPQRDARLALSGLHGIHIGDWLRLSAAAAT